MTPKMKAKELVERFTQVQDYGQDREMNHDLAKQCALICCDEILELEVWDWPHNTPEGKLFLLNVKSEISKL